ncbi:hypothetical protein HRbin17_02523 [bacterium HR17]|uniref:Translocation and assembly module TamB C-terminal domain-containing protein n=1 Tax=Candidatus Fervidibacter japonicus TaxID=2035412 RepID=A0A2H5XFN5_9BACT|nr:hypothetical protein HRbin17_02523 [bacterium HR17]
MTRWTTWLLVAIAMCGIVGIGVFQVRRHLPTPMELAQVLQRELTHALKVPVHIERVEVGITGATLRHIRILPDHRSPTGFLLTVPQVRLQWSWRLLLSPARWRRVVQEQLANAFRQVLVSNATLFLWRDRAGRWNASPLLAAPARSRTALPPVQFRESTVVLEDETLPLPDGRPFRLRLTRAHAEFRRHADRDTIVVRGQIAPPLGTPDSAAELHLTELVTEQGRTTQGQLRVQGLQIAALPQRTRRLVQGRLRLLSGTVLAGNLEWTRRGQAVELRATARGRAVVLSWRTVNGASAVSRLHDAVVTAALQMNGKRVDRWRVAVRLDRPHPYWGQGRLSAEGRQRSWRVRWQGKGLHIAAVRQLVDPEVAARIPLSAGVLSGTVIAGRQPPHKLWIDADVSGERLRWNKAVVQRFAASLGTWRPLLTHLPTPQRARILARVGSHKRQWHGVVTIAVTAGVTQAHARIAWQGDEGSAAWRIRAFPLGWATYRFVVGQRAFVMRWSGGRLSGEGTLRWQPERWRIERATVRLTDGTLQTPGLPPAQVAADVVVTGTRFTVTQARLQWHDRAVIAGAGEFVQGRAVRWRGTVTLTGLAVTRLSAWLHRVAVLPFRLSASGPVQLEGRGVGQRWLANALLHEPVIEWVWQGRCNKVTANRVMIVATPSAVIGWGTSAQITPFRRWQIGAVAVELPAAMRLSGWRAAWDGRTRQVTVTGDVFLPTVTVHSVVVRNVRAHTEISARLGGAAWQVHVTDLAGETGQGEWTDGWVVVRNDATGWQLAAAATGREVMLSALSGFARQFADALRGQFTGQMELRAQPQTVRLRLAGEVRNAFWSRAQTTVFAARVRLTTLALDAQSSVNGWRVAAVSGEGALSTVRVTHGAARWEAGLLHAHWLATQTPQGWQWDARVPQALVWAGQWRGQVNGDSKHCVGRISWAQVDARQLVDALRISRLIPVRPADLPHQGRLGGWLHWSARRAGDAMTDWHAEWEGALTITEGVWRDWTVKLAGARVNGTATLTSVGGQRFVGQLRGDIEGVHILSPDGQAVLNGTVVYAHDGERPTATVQLHGRWGLVSLRRLAERLKLPKPMQGIAEGTVAVAWNGHWQAEGQVRVPAVTVGEHVHLTEVAGNWTWRPSVLALRGWSAQFGGGTVRWDGTIGTAAPYPLTLRLQGDNIALSAMRTVLAEWQTLERSEPSSLSPILQETPWRGRMAVTALLHQDNRRQQITVALNAADVRLGEAVLGAVRLDLNGETPSQKGQGASSFSGTVTVQRNGTVAEMRWQTQASRWQVTWRAGQLPWATVKGLAMAFGGERQWSETVRQWLALPLWGDLWTTGEAEGEKGQVMRLRAEVSAPRVTGVGDEPLAVRVNVLRDEKRWRVQLAQLQQRGATVNGWVVVNDDGAVHGDLQIDGVRRGTLRGVLALLGIQRPLPLPNGVLSGALQLGGTVRRLKAVGSLQAEDVRWAGWRLPLIVVRQFTVDGQFVQVAPGDGEIRWNGNVPPARFWVRLSLDGRGQIEGRLTLPRVPLHALLPPEVAVRVTEGWVQGEWELRGTWHTPRLIGRLDGSVRGVTLSARPDSRFTLQNVRWRLTADGTTARLEELTANWGGGTVTAVGTFTLQEGGLQDAFANTGELTVRVQNSQTVWNGTLFAIYDGVFRLTLRDRKIVAALEGVAGNGWRVNGRAAWTDAFWQTPDRSGWDWLARGAWDVALDLDGFRWQTKGASARLTGTLRLTGKGAEPPLLAGDIVVSDGNIAQLAIGRSGAGQWAYPPAVRFAVTARVGEGLFLRNPQASVLLDGAVRVTGTLAQPRVEGEIRGRTGIVRLPASVLTLTDLSLPFAATVDPLTKTWQWTARLRVEGETQVDIHRIIFFVSGPVDEQSQRLGILPAVTLLATPPLPERTLLERLFGVSLAQLSQALTDWQQLFSGALVQSFMGDLLAPLTTPLAAALHLSEISLVREQTTGRRWLRLGLPLSPRLHILWRQGLSAGDPSAIEVQYFLDKRTSITWMKQENERAEIRIQTSVRF